MTLAVALDLSVARGPMRTGVERYAIELARALSEMPGLRLHLLAGEIEGERLDETLDRALLTAMPAWRRALWRRFRLAARARALGAQLLHVPVSGAPGGAGLALVRTVHDLGDLDPEEVSARRRRRAQRRFERPLPTVFPSAATAQAWRERFEDPPLASVIAHGLESALFEVADSPRGDHGLVLGRVRRRRRPAAVAACLRSGALPGPLLWAGPGTPPGERDGIEYLGAVSDAERLRLLATARYLLVPSRREGFGLPALEAMALGTPVIATPLPALKEFGEGVIAFADLDDQAAVAQAFVQCAEPGRLAEGVTRARRYTWRRAAEAHVAFYRRVLESS
jgi:glycosyltransferase involved in cell wall biosynthesis